MAIYSMYGNELQLNRWICDGLIEAKRLTDGAVRTYRIGEIRADGGYHEILIAIGQPPAPGPASRVPSPQGGA